ncbi:MAG: hypothetical protein ACTSUE_21710 [Promethearchaeota archaeon]
MILPCFLPERNSLMKRRHSASTQLDLKFSPAEPTTIIFFDSSKDVKTPRKCLVSKFFQESRD